MTISISTFQFLKLIEVHKINFQKILIVNALMHIYSLLCKSTILIAITQYLKHHFIYFNI